LKWCRFWYRKKRKQIRKQLKTFREHWQTIKEKKSAGSKAVDALDFPDLDLDEEELNSQPVDASDLDYESNEEDSESNPDRCIKKNMYCCGSNYVVVIMHLFSFVL